MHCACAMLLSGVRQAVQYFCALSHKRHDFRGGGGNVTDHEMFDLIFSTTLM